MVLLPATLDRDPSSGGGEGFLFMMSGEKVDLAVNVTEHALGF